MANSFAYIALFGWPLVVIFLFRLLPQSQAVAWSVIGGYLALPYGAGVYVPMLPDFDKTFIPAASAAIMVLVGGGLPERSPANLARRSGGMKARVEAGVEGGAEARAEGSKREAAITRPSAFTRQKVRHTSRLPPDLLTAAVPVAGPVPRIVIVLLVLLIATPFLTSATNGDPYRTGVLTLPALELYDAFSGAKGTLVMLLPFLLGLFCLGAPDRQPVLLRIFCVAGLIYSLPTLFEIRFSPQLSRWTYGFLAQSFDQVMRNGGFRPVVFLQHGLWLAIFLATAALAAFALWRFGPGRGFGYEPEGRSGTGGWALAGPGAGAVPFAGGAGHSHGAGAGCDFRLSQGPDADGAVHHACHAELSDAARGGPDPDAKPAGHRGGDQPGPRRLAEVPAGQRGPVAGPCQSAPAGRLGWLWAIQNF
jgi:hypothetical protein